MIQELEERLNGNQFILFDTSFRRPADDISICKILYHGLKGLYSLPLEQILKEMECLREVSALIDQKDILVIGEVTKEIEVFAGVYKLQYTNVKDKILTKKKFREVHSKVNEKLAILGNYLKMTERFVKISSNRDPRYSFDQEQRKRYSSLLQIANEYYDSMRKSMEFSEETGNKIQKSSLGERLGTDRKIIATAYTLSYDRPVLILTNDRGIRRFVSAVNGVIGADSRGLIIPERLVRELGSVPKHHVLTFSQKSPNQYKQSVSVE